MGLLLPTLLLAAPGPSAPAAANDEVSFNFTDADIVAATQAVGKFLHRTFQFDPRVKGTLSIHTEHPVTRAEAYQLLLGALRFQGYTIVDVEGVARVVPGADARFLGGPLSTQGDGVQGEALQTVVFRLNYASANAVLTTIRPLITAENPVTVNAAANSVVVTDYGDNLRRIGKLIRELDSPDSASVEVVPLQYVSAADVLPVFEKLVASAPGDAADATQRITTAVEPRLNAILIESASPARTQSARRLLMKLDQPTAVAGNIHLVYLKNGSAVHVAEVLRSILGGGTSAGSGAGSASTSPGAGVSAGTGSDLRIARTPGVAPATTASSSNADSASSGSNGAAGFIQADADTNALIITCSEPVFRNLAPVIEQLDVRRAQVYIEALIVEVSEQNSSRFGIQWQNLGGYARSGTNIVGGTNFTGSDASGVVSGTNIIGVASNPGTLSPGLNIGLVDGQVTIPGVGTISNLKFLAQALESDARTNILSTPNIMTLDNETASIIVGQTIPIVTGSYAQTGGSTGVTPFQTVEQKDIGITLKIKPQIADNGTIKLQIYQEDSSVQSTTTQGYIITNKRAVAANVQVADGQIIALGGLVQTAVNDSDQSVPLLSSIPALGSLFRYRSRAITKTDLMVFLRPYVIRDPSDNTLTNQKYAGMQKRQVEARPPSDPILPDMKGPLLPDLAARTDRDLIAAVMATPAAPDHSNVMVAEDIKEAPLPTSSVPMSPPAPVVTPATEPTKSSAPASVSIPGAVPALVPEPGSVIEAPADPEAPPSAAPTLQLVAAASSTAPAEQGAVAPLVATVNGSATAADEHLDEHIIVAPAEMAISTPEPPEVDHLVAAFSSQARAALVADKLRGAGVSVSVMVVPETDGSNGSFGLCIAWSAKTRDGIADKISQAHLDALIDVAATESSTSSCGPPV